VPALRSLEDMSPEERLALAYCAPRGIPLSVFLGRVVGNGDPQWTPRDAEAAVLWHIEQSARCSGCGRPRNECMVEFAEAPEYEVTPIRCWACEARDKMSQEFREKGGSGSGLYMTVAKVG